MKNMLRNKKEIKQVFIDVLKEEPVMVFEKETTYRMLVEFNYCPDFSLQNLLELQSRIGFKQMNITQEPVKMGSEHTGPFGGEFYFEFW